MLTHLEELVVNNKTTLRDIPTLFEKRMQECVNESTEFQTSRDSNRKKCECLAQEILDLKHKQTMSIAHAVLQKYHTSGLGAHVEGRECNARFGITDSQTPCSRNRPVCTAVHTGEKI